MTVSLKKLTTKTVSDENIADKDEYLNIKETINHVKINKKLNWIDKAAIIPKYVATPLPPLNFNQIGNIWPRKANNEEIIIKSEKYSWVIITGKYPFATSNNRVNNARNLFPVLSTLVAPIFPEPILLTSWPLNIFVKIKPKGIDPHV